VNTCFPWADFHRSSPSTGCQLTDLYIPIWSPIRLDSGLNNHTPTLSEDWVNVLVLWKLWINWDGSRCPGKGLGLRTWGVQSCWNSLTSVEGKPQIPIDKKTITWINSSGYCNWLNHSCPSVFHWIYQTTQNSLCQIQWKQWKLTWNPWPTPGSEGQLKGCSKENWDLNEFYLEKMMYWLVVLQLELI
jgi:hypothetical protein